MTPSQPTKDFEAAIHGALQLWHKAGQANPLAYLVLVQQQQTAIGSSLQAAANQVLLEGLDALAAVHEPDAALLRTRFIDGTPAHKLKVVRKDGGLQYVYLDPDYFLEIRVESQRVVRGVKRTSNSGAL